MHLLDTSAILLTLAAVFGYINHRVFKLPNSIGILLLGLVLSALLLLFGNFWPALRDNADSFVTQIDFNETVMQVMLSFLLFAGALHVNLNDLKNQKYVVAILASVGLLVSTLLVGGAAFFVFKWTGLNVPFLWCLVFGSLISPTDPVAVLGILKKVGVSKSIETKITGESLFNDGVGVVVYIALIGFAVGGGDRGAMDVGLLFIEEVGGGLLLGGLLGYVAYRMLKSIDNYQVEILITLALVTGGYQLASYFHFSGPLAMVVAGLMIGNHGRDLAMSETTRHHLDLFWELIDEMLNAVLFLFHEGNVKGAVTYLEKSTDPENPAKTKPGVWRTLAKAQNESKNFAAALKTGTIILGLKQEKRWEADAMLDLALSQIGLEKYDEAIETTNKALAVDVRGPHLAGLYLVKAEVALRQNQPEQALRDYQKTIQMVLDDPLIKPRALAGAAQSARLLGEDGKADQYRLQLKQGFPNWKGDPIEIKQPEKEGE